MPTYGKPSINSEGKRVCLPPELQRLDENGAALQHKLDDLVEQHIGAVVEAISAT